MKIRMANTLGVVAILTAACATPIADSGDREFATKLWSALADARMVSDDAIRTRPYRGGEPHGAILDYLEHDVTVAGHTGRAIVKKNYEGPGATVEKIWSDPLPYLRSVTVMFRREAGYDAAHRNWFWAKFGADGVVQASGRIGECIACHGRAAGNDYILGFTKPR